jgi:quercetin dioxygenase-like cupin family protein
VDPWQVVAEPKWETMPDYFKSIDSLVTFSADKATKADLFLSRQLFVGLNCFEPGQSQKVHVHTGSDKFYLVMTGKARMTVGDETRVVEAGTVVWAPADLPHGVAEALERTVMLVAIAPPTGGIRRPPDP